MRAKQPKPQIEQGANYATKLLASAFYTRGLWSPFIGWLRLTHCPFRLKALEWGIRRDILRKELKRAFAWSWMWTVIEAALLYAFVKDASAWFGAAFVWLVLLQWLVFPYFAVRSVFRRLDHLSLGKQSSMNNCLILKETESSIPDLGYLLREAIFSIDSTKKLDSWDAQKAATPSDSPNVESFYAEIERAFSGNSNGITTQRLEVVAAKDIRFFREVPAWS